MTKILIAEDDLFLANAYKAKLLKEGFEIQIARDGLEAMQMIESFQPQLLLLDLIMPVKDGFSVLADIKDNEKWKSLPIIITSNLGQQEDIYKGIAMGARDYLVKSDTSMEQLIQKIRTVLETT